MEYICPKDENSLKALLDGSLKTARNKLKTETTYRFELRESLRKIASLLSVFIIENSWVNNTNMVDGLILEIPGKSEFSGVSASARKFQTYPEFHVRKNSTVVDDLGNKARWKSFQINKAKDSDALQFTAFTSSARTEAQWEYACRAGTTTPFCFGETISTEQANYDGNHPYANGKKGPYREKKVAVKALPANAWGLYQLHGNVLEWCQDWYGDYPSGPVQDPKGPESSDRRVLRGGAWYSVGLGLRSAARRSFRPGYRDNSFGFRLSQVRIQPSQEK